jgi:hypothetical protein
MQVLCLECLTRQLHSAVSDLSWNQFPLVCLADHSQAHYLSLVDLRTYTSNIMVEMLLEASLTRHIRANPGIYRNCPTPDCNSVYMSSDLAEIFTCSACLTQTCTLCHAEQHFGLTCAEFQERSENEDEDEDDQALSEYVESTDTKRCPNCAMLIQKVTDDHCQFVKCSVCHIRICWLCMRHSEHKASVMRHLRLDHSLQV